MSKYSLDEENKRKYGVRAEEWEEQAEYYISEKNGLAALAIAYGTTPV